MPAEEQAVNFDRYMVVPRSLIILTNEEKVLLLKGSIHKRLWAGLYNGLGGHIEKDEDIITSTYRELYEESGIIPEKLWLCGIVTVDTQVNPGVCIFIFKGEFNGNPVNSSEGTLEWIDTSNLKNLPLVADLPVLLPKILGHKYDTQPFIAHSHYDQDGKLEVKFP